jgi:5,6-dimethylbenzimidazole synthase
VSILKPKKVNKILDTPKNYKLIGYLCIGYTKQFYNTPELKKIKWEKEKLFKDVVQWV